MSVFTKRAVDVFAPTTAAGQPRGADMGDAMVWGTELERIVDAGLSNGGLIFDTKANLNLSLAHDANASAWVVADGANNGIYRKSGPSGTGSWTKIAELPYSVIYAQNAGTGTADAVEATSAVPISTSPHAQLISVPFTAANTAAMTLSINGETPRPLVTNVGAAIPAGYVQAGMAALVQIDGEGNYRLFSYGDASAIQSAAEAAQQAAEDAADRAESAAAGVEYPVSYAPQTLTPEQQEQARENLGATGIGHALFTAASKAAARGSIGVYTGPGLSGLTLSNNVGDEENDINIAAGFCADATGIQTMRLPVGITKRLDASWSAGSGNGGLDDGSKEANKTYFVHLIQKDDDGSCDALFSTSPLNPVLPTGYSSRRRLGAVLTDDSAKIIPFLQVGYEFGFRLSTMPAAASNDDNVTPTLRQLRVPIGIKVRAIVLVNAAASGVGWVQLRDPDFGPFTSSNVHFGMLGRFTGMPATGAEVTCITNAAGQIYTCDNGSNAKLTMYVKGWQDFLDMNR